MALTVALDAMGGDHGPAVVVPAALSALSQLPELAVVLVGDQPQMESALKGDAERVRLVHTTETVGMDEPPAQAMRAKALRLWHRIQANSGPLASMGY